MAALRGSELMASRLIGRSPSRVWPGVPVVLFKFCFLAVTSVRINLTKSLALAHMIITVQAAAFQDRDTNDVIMYTRSYLHCPTEKACNKVCWAEVLHDN